MFIIKAFACIVLNWTLFLGMMFVHDWRLRKYFLRKGLTYCLYCFVLCITALELCTYVDWCL